MADRKSKTQACPKRQQSRQRSQQNQVPTTDKTTHEPKTQARPKRQQNQVPTTDKNTHEPRTQARPKRQRTQAPAQDEHRPEWTSKDLMARARNGRTLNAKDKQRLDTHVKEREALWDYAQRLADIENSPDTFDSNYKRNSRRSAGRHDDSPDLEPKPHQRRLHGPRVNSIQTSKRRYDDFKSDEDSGSDEDTRSDEGSEDSGSEEDSRRNEDSDSEEDSRRDEDSGSEEESRRDEDTSTDPYDEESESE